MQTEEKSKDPLALVPGDDCWDHLTEALQDGELPELARAILAHPLSVLLESDSFSILSDVVDGDVEPDDALVLRLTQALANLLFAINDNANPGGSYADA